MAALSKWHAITSEDLWVGWVDGWWGGVERERERESLDLSANPLPPSPFIFWLRDYPDQSFVRPKKNSNVKIAIQERHLSSRFPNQWRRQDG